MNTSRPDCRAHGRDHVSHLEPIAYTRASGLGRSGNAQGLVQGVQQGVREGNKAAGPVGGVLGGAIGGVVGVVSGVIGVVTAAVGATPARASRPRRRQEAMPEQGEASKQEDLQAGRCFEGDAAKAAKGTKATKSAKAGKQQQPPSSPRPERRN